MKKLIAITSAALAAAAVAAPAAQAEQKPPDIDPLNDSVACTLEKLGLIHSPIGSFCAPPPWEG